MVLSPFLDAQEVYFEIDPKRRTAYLRGNAPSVLNGTESARHFEKMKGMIQEARFCQEIYNFETRESEGGRLARYGGGGEEIPVSSPGFPDWRRRGKRPGPQTRVIIYFSRH